MRGGRGGRGAEQKRGGVRDKQVGGRPRYNDPGSDVRGGNRLRARRTGNMI
jgi:hypothetical protein